jgi:signal transduction histidine kinase
LSRVDNNAGSSAIAWSHRGDAVKQELQTLKFPSVEYLITGTLPFSTAEELIEDLTSVWCEVLQLEACVLIWRNSFSRSAEIAHRNQPQQKYQRSGIASASPIEAILKNIQDEFPEGSNLQWVTLVVDDAPIGLVGFDKDVSPEIPAGWISISARLLATALTWEWNLTEMKLSALGEYAAGAGHEINNPLAAIKGRAAQLLKEEEDLQRRQLLETIGAQTYRIRDMIGDSMLFAHPPALQRSDLKLTELVESVVHQFADEFHDRQISLYGNRKPDTTISGDETQLCVVISELLKNSLHAVEDRGRIEIDCYEEETQTGNWAILRIADNGCGLTESEREHCFDPFFSGRQAGRGLGFGLSKCWRIVTGHRGIISLGNPHDEMTEFVVSLPIDAGGN